MTIDKQPPTPCVVNRLEESKKVQSICFAEETSAYKALKMAFHGMTMSDFKIFAYIFAQHLTSWEGIEAGTGCSSKDVTNALNKLCGNKSVSGAYRYYLVKQVKGPLDEVSFTLTDKGKKFSQLFCQQTNHESILTTNSSKAQQL